MRVWRHGWKAEPDGPLADGVMVPEFRRLFPWAVTKRRRNWRTGQIVTPMMVDYSKAVPATMAAVQEIDADLVDLRKVDEPVTGTRERFGGLALEEADIDGLTAWLEGAEAPRWIYDGNALQIHIIKFEVSGRTKEGRRLRRLARVAKNYEAGTKAAHFASGYDDCVGDVARVAGEIDRAAAALLKLEPATMAGVMIVARATGEVGSVLALGSTRVALVAALGEHVAESLIRIEAAGTA